VTFEVAGEIVVDSGIEIARPYLTIAGETAPPPGITIAAAGDNDLLSIDGTHDVIVRHLRLVGPWEGGGEVGGVEDIGLDGHSDTGTVELRRILIDHVTLSGGSDGALDVVGDGADVTVQWSFLYRNYRGGTVFPETGSRSIRRMSFHHNVYAFNTDRNPLFDGDIRDVDYVNNVVAEWGYLDETSGYGVAVHCQEGDAPVHANVIENFFASSTQPERALYYGGDVDPDCGEPAGGPWAQGEVVSGTRLGDLFVSGNRLPPENLEHFSTVAGPNPVPEDARVRLRVAEDLATCVLPYAGTAHRTADEEQILSLVEAAISGS
jgi:hypothetical protein